MKQEEKELLLIDLCARLPYGVICYWRIGSELTLNLTEYNGQLTCINKVEIEDSNDYYYDCCFNVCNDSNGNSFQNEDVPIEIVKPYLRPMSSMTEEELRDFANIKFKDNAILEIVEFPKMKCYKGFINVKCKNKNNGDTWTFQVNTRTPLETYYGIDWLNAHHFDYRCLIEKGLALKAKEGMYNVKKK